MSAPKRRPSKLLKPAPFLAKWRFVEMEQWDEDFIDLVEIGHILFKRSGGVWLLGGHIVAAAQRDAGLRSLSGSEMLLRFVEPEGGPVCRHVSTEDEQRRFDSTCRKLHGFLAASRPA